MRKSHVVSPDERRRLLGESTHGAEWPADSTLVDLFEQQVARTPDLVALRCGAETLSYTILERRANQLARRLVADGIGPEDVVAICLEKSPDLLIAILAALKAGAAYLPIDTTQPPERLAFMLGDAKPKRIVTTSNVAVVLRLNALHTCILLDTLEVAANLVSFSEAALLEGDRRSALRSQHPAYVIYTSGSTGRPKGVVVSHAAASQSIRARINHYSHQQVEALPLWAPISFDISIAQIFWALCSGATLVVPERDDVEAAFADALQSGVTHIMLSSSAYASLLVSGGARPSPSLRCVIVGGEVMPRQTIGLHRGAFSDVELFNEYGTTEAAIWSAAWRCGNESAEGPEPIGSPITNTEILVLDAQLKPCPSGVMGELYIAGAGLARGYVDRPGLSASRFVANPFAVAPGERLYRTGDLGEWRVDGAIVFHGRSDQQVKVRGFRVEPGEIEAALVAHPDVSQATVVALDDSNGAPRLVGYLVPAAATASPDLSAVRAHLLARLPEYMVPASYVVLSAMPLTANGKLDRAKLPAPVDEHLGTGEMPTTPEGVVLCEAMATVLGVAQVGLTDHFFQLGGHSLAAIRLAAHIRARLGRDLQVRTIFEKPVVADLARTLRTLPKAGTPLTPQPRLSSLPASFAQARLWFVQQLEGASAAYHIPVAMRLTGALDTKALGSALDEVRSRHEALRTRLVAGVAGPEQHVVSSDALPPALEVIDSTPTTLDAALLAGAARGFDLATTTPMRATLFRLGLDDYALLLLVHHSAADGWSVPVLLDDLARAYVARRCGESPGWPALPVQYADYTLWQRAMLGDADDPASPLARQLAYWRATLADLPLELALPTDRPRPRIPTSTAGVTSFSLPGAVHAQLHALARAEGATLFMVLQAAVAAWLSKQGAGTDIPLGAPVAGRTDAALDTLVGFFVNTLVLRTDTSGDPTFTTLLARARTVCLGAYAHADLPFEYLVEQLAPPRVLGRQPLFQTMLVLQHEPPPRLVLPDVTVVPVAVPTRATKFDLVVTVTEARDPSGQPAGLAGELEYSTDLFDAASAARLADRLAGLLTQVANDPTRTLRRIDLLTPAERHQLLHVFSATTTQGRSATLVDRFEKQVAHRPEAVALCWGSDAELTYGELDARANALAWRLLAAGVGPESRVALWLNRSPELVVGILATLKAGAAYVPLDPATPPGRVARLLADAAPIVVLTMRPLAAGLPEPLRSHGCVLEIPDVASGGCASPAPTNVDRVAPLHPENPAYDFTHRRETHWHAERRRRVT